MSTTGKQDKANPPPVLRVLVACEFSGVVRDAFLEKGHDAWSCDLLPAERNSNRHIQGDVRDVLHDGWDFLIVAHPPCTRLCNSGVRWLHQPHPGKPSTRCGGNCTKVRRCFPTCGMRRSLTSALKTRSCTRMRRRSSATMWNSRRASSPGNSGIPKPSAPASG
jgi:hypothetical protein